MPYPWIRFLHIAAAIAFVGVHGASIAVLYVIRKERDRVRIDSMLGLSAKTVTAMYVSLAAVIGTGLWLGFSRTVLFGQGWYWWSLALLALVTLLMWFVAKPFGEQVRAATEVRPSGTPRVSDEELADILRSARTHVITAIGVIGLVAILYLMVFQPDLWPQSAEVASPQLDTAATDLDGNALLALGKEIYEVSGGGVGCAACHAMDGQGTPNGPNIIGVSKSAISESLGGGVPAMGFITLTAEEVAAVYQYITTLP
jgi:cytochrome c553